MKRLRVGIVFILMLFVVGLVGNPAMVYAQEQYAKVITNTTKLYAVSDSRENVLKTLEFDERVQILEENILGADNIKFSKVKTQDETEGFVVSTHILNLNSESLKKNLDVNAKINKDNAKFYVLEDSIYKEVEGITLTTQTKLKLINGYDKSQTYLKAMVEVDNEIKVGYVHLDDVAVSGISLETILAVVILLVCCTVGGIVIYKVIKKRRDSEV